MSIPKDLEDLIKPVRIEEIHAGCSGDLVFRAEGSDGARYYIKLAHGEGAAELEQERDMLLWLRGRGGAPHLRFFQRRAEESCLCMDEVPGVAASELVSVLPPERILDVLSQALRAIHSLTISGCPVDRRLEVTVQLARQRVRDRRVDLADLEPVRFGCSEEDLLRELEAAVPADEDLVVTHGDYCLPNVLLREGVVSGTIDWGRGGVADRYQDIALLLRSFEHNIDSQQMDIFCGAYGIRKLDHEKIQFYQLLDEFF